MHTSILNLVFRKQCIPVCSGQLCGHLQEHKLQSLGILKVQNEILNVSKPVQSGNYNHMSQ
jgi:hypothetical protein